MYFQGNIILFNLFEYLFNDRNIFNMQNATNIMISGFGVSSVSVLSYIDKIYAFMRELNSVDIKIALWNPKNVY
eukprot:UN06599